MKREGFFKLFEREVGGGGLGGEGRIRRGIQFF